jgi:hypothetical protein
MAGDTSGVLELATNGSTTAITIDASQRAAFVAGTAAAPAITTTGDTNTGIFFSAADTIDFAEGGTAVGQFDSSANFKFNSGYGSVETAYGCRAWVNFDGTGTPAIRASGNVSSITDVGTGEYRVNFTNAMPDENYSVITGTAGNVNRFLRDTYYQITNPGFVNILCFFSADNANTLMALADSDPVTVAIFR